MARSLTLRTNLLLRQLVMVLFAVVVLTMTAVVIQWFQLREAHMDRALGVAQSVADLPAVREAYLEDSPSESIQPVAELIREASDMTFVVVTDAEGIRYSHPNEARIGQLVSSDPSAATSGEIYLGREDGTLGDTLRAKVPVYDDDGQVVGQVSVGILHDELREDVLAGLPLQLGVTLLVALVGFISAGLTARHFHRRTYGLDPEQIAGLLEGREAILHGAREGIVAVDTLEKVVLINDAARQMLGLEGVEEVEGRAGQQLLPQPLAEQLQDADGTEHLVLVEQRLLLARADAVMQEEMPVGAALMLRDHTELHETLTELEGAQSLMEQLHSQAHEFQNQLHVIDGLLELDDMEGAKAYVQRISQGGVLSRLDASEGEVDAELEALLLAKMAVARASAVDFRHEGLALWPHAREADIKLRDDLLAVVGNLLDNALEATGEGGVVKLSVQRNNQWLRILMDDSGPGVPESDRETVFISGVSTKKAERARGFGLPLVRQIAQRRFGDVSVDTSSFGGARFEVVLQIANITQHSEFVRGEGEDS